MEKHLDTLLLEEIVAPVFLVKRQILPIKRPEVVFAPSRRAVMIEVDNLHPLVPNFLTARET